MSQPIPFQYYLMAMMRGETVGEHVVEHGVVAVGDWVARPTNRYDDYFDASRWTVAEVVHKKTDWCDIQTYVDGSPFMRYSYPVDFSNPFGKDTSLAFAQLIYIGPCPEADRFSSPGDDMKTTFTR